MSKPYLVQGSTGGSIDELGDELNKVITMRNAVAHRDFGMARTDSNTLPYATDAQMSVTINTSSARVAVAPMLQLVTQAIDGLRAMTSSPGQSCKLDKRRFPVWWFTGKSPDGTTPLWGNAVIPRHRDVG